MDFISGPVVGFLPWLMPGIDVLGSVSRVGPPWFRGASWAERFGRPLIVLQ